MRVLVSIISEQTIPNLLVVKELNGSYDSLLFITTRTIESQGKSIFIERALRISEGSIQRIVVPSNNYYDVLTILESADICREDVFIVNMTGGTKLMMLGAFTFFSKLKSQFVYLAIESNSLVELNPKQHVDNSPIKYSISVGEYLTAHGLYFTNGSTTYSNKFTSEIFEKFKKNKFKREAMDEFINAHSCADSSDKTYFSGGWFEEYCYFKIKKALKLKDSEIMLNVKIYSNPDEVRNDNEFDILYVKDNALRVIECKYQLGKESNIKQNIDGYLNKLGAISKNFGIKASPALITLADLDRINPISLKSIMSKSSVVGVKKIVSSSSFKSEDVLKETIQQL